jgi:hypothetical protein
MASYLGAAGAGAAAGAGNDAARAAANACAIFQRSSASLQAGDKHSKTCIRGDLSIASMAIRFRLQLLELGLWCKHVSYNVFSMALSRFSSYNSTISQVLVRRVCVLFKSLTEHIRVANR